MSEDKTEKTAKDILESPERKALDERFARRSQDFAALREEKRRKAAGRARVEEILNEVDKDVAARRARAGGVPQKPTKEDVEQ